MLVRTGTDYLQDVAAVNMRCEIRRQLLILRDCHVDYWFSGTGERAFRIPTRDCQPSGRGDLCRANVVDRKGLAHEARLPSFRGIANLLRCNHGSRTRQPPN